MQKIVLTGFICLLLLSSGTASADEWIVRLTIPILGAGKSAAQVAHLLRTADGVTEWDIHGAVKEVTITYDSEYIDLESLQQRLASSGFPAAKTVILKEG